MSESGNVRVLSVGGAPVRTVVYEPSIQCEYWSTTWSVDVQPVRKRTRGDRTANEYFSLSTFGAT